MPRLKTPATNSLPQLSRDKPRRQDPSGAGVIAAVSGSARLRQAAVRIPFWLHAAPAHKVIACELGLSASTVRVHIARATRMLGVRTRSELFKQLSDDPIETDRA